MQVNTSKLDGFTRSRTTDPNSHHVTRLSEVRDPYPGGATPHNFFFSGELLTLSFTSPSKPGYLTFVEKTVTLQPPRTVPGLPVQLFSVPTSRLRTYSHTLLADENRVRPGKPHSTAEAHAGRGLVGQS